MNEKPEKLRISLPPVTREMAEKLAASNNTTLELYIHNVLNEYYKKIAMVYRRTQAGVSTTMEINGTKYYIDPKTIKLDEYNPSGEGDGDIEISWRFLHDKLPGAIAIDVYISEHTKNDSKFEKPRNIFEWISNYLREDIAGRMAGEDIKEIDELKKSLDSEKTKTTTKQS